MAYIFDTNNTPATAADAIFRLKELLKSAGWTTPWSSDGTTLKSDGSDQITGAGSGANGMDNAKAWFVVQEPAAPGRQFSFQRQNTVGANTSYLWRVKYSKGAGFSGGTPTATKVGSATDEAVLLGTGTDATPTMAALFATATDAGFRWSACADNASPYSWASHAWVNTTALPTHALFFDPVTVSTAADVDAVAIYINGVISANANGGVAGAGCCQYESFLRNNAKLQGYYNGTFSTALFAAALMVSNTGTYKLVGPSGLDVNLDSKDDVFNVPIIYFNIATNLGSWKGLSTLMKWPGVIRATGSTLTTTGAKDRVILCDISLPWDGSTPTV